MSDIVAAPQNPIDLGGGFCAGKLQANFTSIKLCGFFQDNRAVVFSLNLARDFAAELRENTEKVFTGTQGTPETEDTDNGWKPRSREEILAWLGRARRRKEEIQRRARQEWQEEQRRKKEALASEYYNFDWWE